jgi:hypothetical protein
VNRGRRATIWPRCTWTLDPGRGKRNVPARSCAVMEGRVEPYLWRIIPDLGTSLVPRMACRTRLLWGTGVSRDDFRATAADSRPERYEPSSCPGIQFVVSFREGEAPAEPYTTEKTASSGGPAGTSPSLEAGEGEARGKPRPFREEIESLALVDR